MTTPATAYDAVAYPSTVFPATHPDRLATIARLHGLAAPPIETARVLEIGGGDGVNLIAMAAAWPRAQFFSFDLSTTAVARGAALVAASGLTNVRVETGDICAAATDLDAQFDYIIAHGVYAWVPEPVRAAVMALIGRTLSAEGVAFISYNALPGGHMRRMVREMALHAVGHIADPGERVLAARAFLAELAEPCAGDRPVVAAMRDVARPMATKLLSTLYHDELGDVYAPQSLTEVIAAAAPHGLAFLNDASPNQLVDGLPGAGLDDAATLRMAQASDDRAMVFFHETLLVRPGRGPQRAADPAGIAALYVASQAVRHDGNDFTLGDGSFSIGDDQLADAVASLAAIWPRRMRAGDLVDGDDRLLALYQLFTREAVMLHATALPGVRTAGECPTASPLALAQVRAGSKAVFTLDHRVMALTDAGPRAFLALLDGSRDRTALVRDWAASGFGAEIPVDAALAQFAAAALLIR